MRQNNSQLVIFVHCLVNSADASGFDPEENPGTQQKKDGIIKCLVQIGIPMFFYIDDTLRIIYNADLEIQLSILWLSFYYFFPEV